MTKLVKKSVDVERVLSKPRQSWMERLMAWGLSKPAIATVFVAITGWLGKALAQSSAEAAWMVSGVKVSTPFQNPRKMIFICGFFLMLICAVLALFKKVSWFVLLNILSCLSFVAVAFLTIDILTDSELNFETFAIFIAAIVLFLLPFLISSIQYKCKKIDEKLLKRRLLIWIITFPILLIPSVVLSFFVR